MSDDVQRVPGRVVREPFSAEEQADVTNREARAYYWSKRQRAADEAEAARVLKTLPVEKRSTVMHDFLEGKKTHAQLVADVLSEGSK
jgi:hypothetical protein